MFRKLLLLSVAMIFSLEVFSQDSLILISGRVIPVQSVDLQEFRIAYRKLPKESLKAKPSQTGSEDAGKKKKSRLKTIDPYRVFSVKYSDGTEKIIYKPDSLDPLEFSQEQMRIFIKGEQDAAKYYKNNLNKGIGLGLGMASGLLGFYGLAGPPLYATIMGSFTPNLNSRLKKQNALENARIQLEKTPAPIAPPDPETGSQAQLDYNIALEKHAVAEANYNRALKDHPKNISFSDTRLLELSEYREGYERKARDRKIRNTMLSGLAGFIITVVGLPIIY
ncbi:MAG TPA: hypothetical protein PKJ62_00625 [Bacteroidia bacterium]|nr:hypothetical protein [Bacteroidia bacterium]HNS13485.1 hypothetical protein [Bacteroidia bacterium]